MAGLLRVDEGPNHLVHDCPRQRAEDSRICVQRHKLEYDDDDIKFASHIDYSIRPDERHRGFGTLQLTLALREAAKCGIHSVRIICSDQNIASIHTILSCHGVLIDSIYGEESELTVLRFDVPTESFIVEGGNSHG